MTGAAELFFENDKVLEQAFGNVNALILSTLAYLKEQGQAGSDWVRFIGNSLAPNWESMKGSGARDVASRAVLNMATGGAEPRSISGDETQSEAVIVYTTPQIMLDAFKMSQDEVDVFLDIFSPIAQYLGMTYSWER